MAVACMSGRGRRFVGSRLDRFAQRHRKEGKAAFNAEAAQVGATPQVDMLTVTEATPPVEVADRPSVTTTPRSSCGPAGTCSTASR